MERVGSPSWRLSVNDSPQSISVALSVREALDLPVPASPDTPPRRVAGKVHREVGLSDAERREAGEQWLAWWRRLVDVEFRTHRPMPMPTEGDIHTLVRGRMAERQQVFDPPTFAALSESPALRTAVLAIFEKEFVRRATDERRYVRGQRGFDWALTRDVTDELIAEFAVSPDRLDASVMIIDVPGHWYRIPRPGTAVCSLELTADAQASKRLLREVFVSGLGLEP